MAVMPNIVGELNKQNGIKEEVFTGVGENALEVEKEFPQRTCQFRTNSLKEGRGATLRRQVTLYTHYMSGRLTQCSCTFLSLETPSKWWTIVLPAPRPIFLCITPYR